MLTLIIIILSIYLLGKLLKWILPIYIMRNAQKFGGQPFGSQFSQQQKQQNNQKPTQKEGNVTVEVNNKPNQKIDKKLGDYVEYVEEEDVTK